MSYIEDNGYFVFDGVKSSDYGVWINGSGTYNAPARRYKEYTVPGRNGTLTIDEGAFEEVEQTYPAFISRDFPSNIEGIRNQLMARTGHVMMKDSYHPDEFYRATYMSGLEADVAPNGIAGSFKLKFKRDPRRFLEEGESITTYPGGITKSKNLLSYPYQDTTKTAYGITWTDVGDGTIKTSGKRNGSSTPTFNVKGTSTHFTLPPDDYILTGCPAGGGSSTYRITLQKYENGTSTTLGYDIGSGYEFTVTSSTTEYRMTLYMYQYDANDIVFKPMIRRKYGNNIVPYPYYGGDSTTSYSVTYTATANSVSLSNTSTGQSTYQIRSTASYPQFTLPAGSYTLTGCPAGGSTSTYYLDANYSSTTYYDTGNGVTFELSEEKAMNIRIRCLSGVDATGLVFYPFLQSNAVSDDTWLPYYDGATSIYNPTLYTSRPLIRVTGYGTLTINSDVITIASGQTYVDIDSEIQDCYYGTTNKNSKVSFQSNSFPVLKPGVNSISYTGNITKVEITPRWYRI